MGVLTLGYAIIAFINLGSTHFPRTFWKPHNSGDSAVVDLGANRDVRQIKSLLGLGKGAYTVSFSPDGVSWHEGARLRNSSAYKEIEWRVHAVREKARYVTVAVDEPGAMLFEVGFCDSSGATIRGASIARASADPRSQGAPVNIIDESSTVPAKPGFFNSMYFDELYYARTAYEHLHGLEPTETTHPPLGKVIISIGILLFGMTPFGWRFCGTAVGIAMVPVMYLFAKRVFKRSDAAFLASFLFAFDFMHFVQTRIATIDTYGVFFIILMFYFMYRYFVLDFWQSTTKALLVPLSLSGLCFGLGAASKWITFYGAAGLFIIYAWSLTAPTRAYFAARGRLAVKRKDLPKAEREKDQRTTTFFPRRCTAVLACGVLAFLVVPGLIYVLAYTPVMNLHGPGHGIGYVKHNQRYMYDYHSQLKSTHPFSSKWYEWPVMTKPIWYFEGKHEPAGKVSSIVALGNPAVWWPALPCALLAIAVAARRKDRSMMVIVIAMASQYVPWIVSPRKLGFIYHFFATVPFMVLCITYVYTAIPMRRPVLRRGVLLGYCAVVLGLFVAFYPILSGMEVDRSYVLNRLQWLPKWYFAR